MSGILTINMLVQIWLLFLSFFLKQTSTQGLGTVIRRTTKIVYKYTPPSGALNFVDWYNKGPDGMQLTVVLSYDHSTSATAFGAGYSSSKVKTDLSTATNFNEVTLSIFQTVPDDLTVYEVEVTHSSTMRQTFDLNYNITEQEIDEIQVEVCGVKYDKGDLEELNTSCTRYEVVMPSGFSHPFTTTAQLNGVESKTETKSEADCTAGVDPCGLTFDFSGSNVMNGSTVEISVDLQLVCDPPAVSTFSFFYIDPEPDETTTAAATTTTITTNTEPTESTTPTQTKSFEDTGATTEIVTTPGPESPPTTAVPETKGVAIWLIIVIIIAILLGICMVVCIVVCVTQRNAKVPSTGHLSHQGSPRGDPQGAEDGYVEGPRCVNDPAKAKALGVPVCVDVRNPEFSSYTLPGTDNPGYQPTFGNGVYVQ